MSRTLSTTISSAIAKVNTKPVYLVQMGFDSLAQAATWDASILWNGVTWAASGIEIKGLNAGGARMILPNVDLWLGLVLNDGTRDRAISIYEWHEDTTASPQTDAVLVFVGIMDEATITDKITITLIESSRSKSFPALTIDQPVFTHLMTSGDTITWGADVITVT